MHLQSGGILTHIIASLLGFHLNKPPQKLSELGLFKGDIKNLESHTGIIYYELINPLFSDYAYKIRFVKLPPGTQATYHESEVFDFPVGTLLIKNFYYPQDFRIPDGARRILETRILAKTEKGWEAWPYLWNEEQSEAFYDVAGKSVWVSWIHFDGKKRSINYVVPNKNQCKQCHEYKGGLSPIGLAARHLNKPITYYGQTVPNQLDFWATMGLLKDFPGSEVCEKLAAWDDPSESTEDRARSYLDINCGHCHRPEGQASNSGLFLNIREQVPMRLGIMKPPVAAGRASAHMKFSIAPGQPDQSILIYRMASLDPGIMMPEMGRKTVDEEGIKLLRQWISQMKN